MQNKPLFRQIPSISLIFQTEISSAAQAEKKSGKQTKFKTYLKLDLDISVTSKDDYDSVQKEVFKVLHGIWAALISIDSRNTYILSWHERDANKFPVIKQGDTPPSNRFGVEQKYVENWAIGWFADSTQIRFHIGHEKDLDKYLSSSKVCNLVEESMGLLYKDKLQTSETVPAVWMGGPIPDEATQELIEETILTSSIFTSNGITNLELQVLPVRIKKGSLSKGSKRVKAVHAVCPIEDSDKVRDILKRMYPSKPRKEYPEGVQRRAIENTADPDFPVPPRARMIAE
jgi:hypothetical protein